MAVLIASSSTPPSSGFSTTWVTPACLGAGDHALGLVSHHQDDGDAEPGKSAIDVAVHHPRKHVLIEDETAGRIGRPPWRASKECSSQSLTSKPSSSSEKRKEFGQDPIAYGDQNGCGFRQINLLQAHLAALASCPGLRPCIREREARAALS